MLPLLLLLSLAAGVPVAGSPHDSSLQGTAMYAVEELRNLTQSPELALLRIESHRTEEITHGVQVDVPIFKRMVMHDTVADTYKIMRVKVHQTQHVDDVVEKVTHMTLALRTAEGAAPGACDASAGSGTCTLGEVRAQVAVSEDHDGFMGISRFTSPHFNAARVGEEMQKQLLQERTPTRPESYLDVMCLNIWNYNHWQPRRKVLKAALAKSNPHILGFQEVRARRSAEDPESRMQVTDIAKMLPGYQYVYQPAMMFHDSSLGEEELHHEGLAIFSRFPILETSYLKLSRDPNDSGDFHQRICLRALVETPIGNVNLFVTHLSLSKKARRRTIRELSLYLRASALKPKSGQYAQRRSMFKPNIGKKYIYMARTYTFFLLLPYRYVTSFPQPAVLVGDLNAVFSEEGIDLERDYGLVDAWSKLHPGDKGWTFNSWKPQSRIDYVFTKDVEPISMIVTGKKYKKKHGLRPIGGVKNMK